MNRPVSSASLPDPLRGTDPDSFTHRTVVRRWPRIAGQVVEENDFPKALNEQIRQLQDDIPEGLIRPLEDDGAPDTALWDTYVQPYQGQRWLDVPWFFGETYFYRRILEATGYFQAGPGGGVDPFTYQKEQGLAHSAEGARALAQQRSAAREGEEGLQAVAPLLRTALWGNQADLSMWGAEEDGPDHRGTDRAEEHLLSDDTSTVLRHLDTRSSPARVDVWADNAGFELVTDLALIDGLLATEAVGHVVMHVKAHPTFVSDATIDDVHTTVGALQASNDAAVQALGERLRTALAEGRLRLVDPWVWTSPLRGREFPDAVRARLARSDLIISKGDANYRRLLGDRHWDFTAPFARAAAPLPTPVLALRTLKSEMVAGLTSAQLDRLRETDPDWAINGEWGLIQFAPAAPHRGSDE
jgi:uncharacterized protein with ATP-grasp and redox domains